MKSRTRPSFWQTYWRLPPEIRRQAYHAYRRSLNTPNLPGLGFKLVDKEERIYSVRMSDDTITWYFIGTHDEYIRMLNP